MLPPLYEPDEVPRVEVRHVGMAGTGNNLINGSVAVVLLQLGGPDSLAAVEPFLYNLFSDPDIIDFPFARLARPTLARMISSRRAKHVQQHYASIGGKSPIRERTDQQARALEGELRKKLDARVFVAMRYWHPLTQETIAQIAAQNFRKIVLLPLYPQYSKTTTGSSLNEWHRRSATAGKNGHSTKIVKEFFEHPAYIDAVVEKINQGLENFSVAKTSDSSRIELAGLREATEEAPDVHLVFSAHGVPMSVIEAGDPYQAQIEATVKLTMERGGWRNSHRLCYQSRVGPGRWLRPSLDEELKDLAAQGVEKVLAIPIAFVSDHVETLSEIDIEARDLAGRLGINQFEVMPALNDSPKFIQALTELVLQAISCPQPIENIE